MKCRSSQDNCIKEQQLLFPIGHTTLTTVHCTTTRAVNETSWEFSQYSVYFQYTMPNECLNSVLRFREMSLTALTSAPLRRRAHIKSDSSQHKLFDKTVSAVIYHHGLASHRRCRGDGELTTNHLTTFLSRARAVTLTYTQPPTPTKHFYVMEIGAFLQFWSEC